MYTPSSACSHTVYVKVTDAASVVATSNTVPVTVNAALSVSISPTSVTLDVGQSQLFTSTVSGGTSPYTYKWYLNNVAVSGATSSTWTFTPSSSGSYSVYVNVTDSVGLRAKSNIASVTVNPTLSVTVSPSSAVLDVGQSQLFTSSVSGGTSPYTYQWYLNGVAVSGATSSSWTFTPSSAGSYTVYAKVTDAASATATSNTATATVNPALSVSISPSTVTLDVGQSQTFTSSVSGGTSPCSYQWYLNGSAVSGATGSSYTFAPSSRGRYTFYLNVTDSADAKAQSNTATATVNKAPSVTISPSSVTMDVGQSQTFTSSTSGGTSSFTYQWYLDSSAVSGATSSSWTYSPSSPGSHTVYVKVTDSASTPVTAPSNTVNVTVNSAPSVTISPASETMDVGQSQQLTLSASGGTSPYSYQWYLNGTAISGATSSSYTFTPSSRGQYNFYCNITDSANVRAQSNTATVVVNSALSVSISPSSFTLDAGQSQTLTSTITGGTSPYAYQWCLNGSAIDGATGGSYTFTPSSRGRYTFYLNVADSVNSEAQSSVVTATVNSALSVKISPTSSIMDVGQSQLFTSSVSDGTSPYIYQWYLDGSPVSGATSATWTYTSSSSGSHAFYAKVTDAVSAAATSNTALVTVNGGLSVSISPTSVVLDVGQSQTFASTASGGTGLYSYQWYLDGVAVSGATSATWTYTSSAGLHTIYVKVTDSASVPVTAQSNTGSVVVNAALSVTISPSPLTLDVGQSQLFTSIVSNGTSPYSYQWYLDGFVVSGATNATWAFVPTSAGSYTVYLNLTDSIGVIAISDTATVTVKLHDVAVTNVTSSKTQIVEGDDVSVNITVKNEGGVTETFNVTLYGTEYGNSWPIYTFTGVTLAPGKTTTLTIDGRGFTRGIYTLSAYAWPVPGETHTSDNTYTGPTVLVAPFARFRTWTWMPPIAL